MSKVVYIKPADKHDTDNTSGSVEVHGELLGNDIDVLADNEQNETSDNESSDNIFGY